MNKIDINSYETNASNSIPLKVQANNTIVLDKSVTPVDNINQLIKNEQVTDENNRQRFISPELGSQIRSDLQTTLNNIRKEQQFFSNRLADTYTKDGVNRAIAASISGLTPERALVTNQEGAPQASAATKEQLYELSRFLEPERQNKVVVSNSAGNLQASTTSSADIYSLRGISDYLGNNTLSTSLTKLNNKTQVATLNRQGTVKIKDSLGDITDFDASDPVALSAARGKWLYDNKAPIPHSSSDTTYGIGTSTQYGHVKIINRDDRTDFVAGEALSAYIGSQLRTSIVNDRDYRTKFLGGLYNAYFIQASCGVLTVKQNESTQQNVVFGIDTWNRSSDSAIFGPAHTGKIVPTFPSEIPHSEAARGNYGIVPCWTQTDSAYFATPVNPIDSSSDSVQGNSSIILKHKGSYLLIYKLIARPNRQINLTEDYTVNNNTITFNYEKMYTYLSQQLTMRFQIDTDVYDSTYYSVGANGTFTSWAPPNYQSALILNNSNRRTFVQSFGAQDEGISFQIIHTIEDNVRILTRIFSNNRFNNNKQGQLLTVGLDIIHLHTAASDWNDL